MTATARCGPRRRTSKHGQPDGTMRPVYGDGGLAMHVETTASQLLPLRTHSRPCLLVPCWSRYTQTWERSNSEGNEDQDREVYPQGRLGNEEVPDGDLQSPRAVSAAGEYGEHASSAPFANQLRGRPAPAPRVVTPEYKKVRLHAGGAGIPDLCCRPQCS